VTPRSERVRSAGRVVSALLRLYPRPFRREYGAAIAQLIRDQRRDLGDASAIVRTRFWLSVLADTARSASAERIYSSFSEAVMGVAIFTGVVAVFLGFGAVQELIVRGIGNGEVQPAIVGVAGAVASLLILAAGVAYARRKPYARKLCLAAAIVSIVVHGYASLPPHVNVGRLALLVAVVSGVVLVVAALRTPGERAQRESRARA
jgi:hypothetical protein